MICDFVCVFCGPGGTKQLSLYMVEYYAVKLLVSLGRFQKYINSNRNEGAKGTEKRKG